MVTWPEDWEEMTLSEFAEINPNTTIPDRFIYVDLEAVKGVSLEKPRHETKKSAPSRAKRYAKKGDVFYQMVRPYQRNNYLFNLDGDYVFSTGYAQLRTNNNPAFLFFLVRSDYFVEEVLNNCTGTSYPAINPSNLASIRIHVPPLEEQIAIADTLSAFDAHLSNLSALIAKKRAIRQGALEDLITGRTRLEGFSGSWQYVKLGDCVTSKLSYGLNASAIPYDGKNPAYIRITDITTDGRYDDSDKKSVLTSERERYTLHYGDIVIARTGASTGKSYLYDPKDGELLYAGYLIKASIDCEKYNPRFIALQLQTRRYWSWVAANSMRTGQPGINSKEYSSFPIVSTSREEQDAIADTLSALDHDITNLNNEHAKISAIRQAAINDLLSGSTRLSR